MCNLGSRVRRELQEKVGENDLGMRFFGRLTADGRPPMMVRRFDDLVIRLFGYADMRIR